MTASDPIGTPQRVDLFRVLTRFDAWLTGFGEVSRDHQTFFAGRLGGAAKRLYYERPRVGVAAVAPLVACEALLPSARQLFHRDTRFPIADAHYAMGYAFLHQATGHHAYLDRAIHFLHELEQSRCPGFTELCWGYPFDWVTRNGTIPAQTPLITSTPYAYEAFLHVHRIEPRDEWLDRLQSIARHAAKDIKDFLVSATSRSCSYTPYDGGGVINASAYRAFLLTSAAIEFGNDEYASIAAANLEYVLDAQNADGSWYYATDGVRDFVDHFHTCFVMKALAKVHALTANARILDALSRGLDYYFAHLFDADGLPRPFAKPPRLTVYKRELYDCAECINLCLLLKDRFPMCESTRDVVVGGVIRDWVKADGSFRSRKLFVGWDNVPMHRWAQSQMFRSLASCLAAAFPAVERTGPGQRDTIAPLGGEARMVEVSR